MISLGPVNSHLCLGECTPVSLVISPPRPLSLPADLSGRLWLSSMPGRWDALDSFIDWCTREGIDRVVCLAPDDEIAVKSPDYHAALHGGSIPLPVMHFPVPDYKVTSDLGGFMALAEEILDPLRAEGRIVIHCAADILHFKTDARKALAAYLFSGLRRIAIRWSLSVKFPGFGLAMGCSTTSLATRFSFSHRRLAPRCLWEFLFRGNVGRRTNH